MTEKTLIFGKDTWPFTTEAREAYKHKGEAFEYINVLSNPDKLKTMLKHSNGTREVPVIVKGDSIAIGYKGKSWGV